MTQNAYAIIKRLEHENGLVITNRNILCDKVGYLGTINTLCMTRQDMLTLSNEFGFLSLKVKKTPNTEISKFLQKFEKRGYKDFGVFLPHQDGEGTNAVALLADTNSYSPAGTIIALRKTWENFFGTLMLNDIASQKAIETQRRYGRVPREISELIKKYPNLFFVQQWKPEENNFLLMSQIHQPHHDLFHCAQQEGALSLFLKKRNGEMRSIFIDPSETQ